MPYRVCLPPSRFKQSDFPAAKTRGVRIEKLVDVILLAAFYRQLHLILDIFTGSKVETAVKPIPLYNEKIMRFFRLKALALQWGDSLWQTHFCSISLQ